MDARGHRPGPLRRPAGPDDTASADARAHHRPRRVRACDVRRRFRGRRRARSDQGRGGDAAEPRAAGRPAGSGDQEALRQRTAGLVHADPGHAARDAGRRASEARPDRGRAAAAGAGAAIPARHARRARHRLCRRDHRRGVAEARAEGLPGRRPGGQDRLGADARRRSRRHLRLAARNRRAGWHADGDPR